jgi:hypothetical protein
MDFGKQFFLFLKSLSALKSAIITKDAVMVLCCGQEIKEAGPGALLRSAG